MSGIKALQPAEYKDMYWHQPDTFQFASNDNFSPLSVTEVTEAAASLPIVFIKQGANLRMGVLQSFQPDRNLFVNSEGRWMGVYRPNVYSFYPFCLVDHEDKRILCERVGSGLITQSNDGVALFDDDGEKSPELDNILQQLSQHKSGLDRAAELTERIVDLDLLTEWPIEINIDDKPVALSGIYRIDENKLEAIPESKILELKNSGVFHVCYSQLVSIFNARLLVYLHNSSAKARSIDTDFLNFDSGGSINFDNL